MESSSCPPKTNISFADFQLDLANGELFRNEKKIKLASQPARVLCLLVSRAGEIVSRRELQSAVWDEKTFVDFEQGLNWCIRQLRAVLGDDAASPRFIETVPKRGYRFLASCESSNGFLPASTPLVRSRAFLVLVAGFCLLMAAGTAFTVWRSHHTSRTTTVLVLPVDNFTGDEKNEPFADGLTDQMIAGLGSANPARLKVIDRVTAAKFKRSQECILHIGKQLHADFVLIGSLVPSNGGRRISAGLFRVADNTQVWSTDAYGLPAVTASTANVAEQIALLLSRR